MRLVGKVCERQGKRHVEETASLGLSLLLRVR